MTDDNDWPHYALKYKYDLKSNGINASIHFWMSCSMKIGASLHPSFLAQMRVDMRQFVPA